MHYAREVVSCFVTRQFFVVPLVVGVTTVWPNSTQPTLCTPPYLLRATLLIDLTERKNKYIMNDKLATEL